MLRVPALALYVHRRTSRMPLTMLTDVMPSREGKVAGIAYLISIVSFYVMILEEVEWWAIPLAESVAYFIMLLIIDVKIVQIIFIAHSLGLVFSTGGLIAASEQQFFSFGWYMMAMSFFHWSEYITTSIFNVHTLSLDSFLINHSWEYGLAAVASWLEFWIEYYLFPSAKTIRIIFLLGLVLVVLGEALRKVAMFTAGSNFTHQVQAVKHPNHTLVTTGVYSLFRHPSYVGWFYWSIGTQLLVCNPICSVAYAIVSWMFFNERILEEEKLLICFFGEQYMKYKEKVGTGIPFLQGYKHKIS